MSVEPVKKLEFLNKVNIGIYIPKYFEVIIILIFLVYKNSNLQTFLKIIYLKLNINIFVFIIIFSQ
jgi:hypothetical protein